MARSMSSMSRFVADHEVGVVVVDSGFRTHQHRHHHLLATSWSNCLHHASNSAGSGESKVADAGSDNEGSSFGRIRVVTRDAGVADFAAAEERQAGSLNVAHGEIAAFFVGLGTACNAQSRMVTGSCRSFGHGLAFFLSVIVPVAFLVPRFLFDLNDLESSPSGLRRKARIRCTRRPSLWPRPPLRVGRDVSVCDPHDELFAAMHHKRRFACRWHWYLG